MSGLRAAVLLAAVACVGALALACIWHGARRQRRMPVEYSVLCCLTIVALVEWSRVVHVGTVRLTFGLEPA